MDISNDNNGDDISNDNNDDDISNDNNDDDISNDNNDDNNENNDNDEDDVEINYSEHDQHSDDDQYSDEDIEDFNEIEALREWAIKYNIKHTHLDSLLQILRKRMLPELPKSSKTFLKTTSAEYEIKQFKGPNDVVIGEFAYFGITKHLQRCVNTDLHKENKLYLQFNIDGLPLFKSSSQQFWPILCKIYFYPDVYNVFPVAIYAGTEKPNNLNEYLSGLIKELNELLEEGIEINGRIFEVHIKCFVCDRPARSFIKCIKGHGGFYSCERCTICGERYKKRTVYISTNCDERSDRSFRNLNQPEHHTSISPLNEISQLNMINHFVLDFMHLCCLGIMKKLLTSYWLGGNRSTKLSQNSRCQLSEILISLQSQVPEDFQRTTRSIFDISKWKATELSFFLLYCGPIVLKRILPSNLYKHFLLFHAACRILYSQNLALKFHGRAKIYLTRFVQLLRNLYGTESQIMNMHSLIHLTDDVTNMKCSLSSLTAFPFENTLGKIKNMLRSGNRPLSQICRRLHETFFANEEKIALPPTINNIKVKRILPSGEVCIKKLHYKEAILSCNSPNNTVLLKNGLIMQIDKIYNPLNEDNNAIQISGNILNPEKSIFIYPCNSETLNMWKVSKSHIRKNSSLRSVVSKMVHFQINDNYSKKNYVMPLLHQ